MNCNEMNYIEKLTCDLEKIEKCYSQNLMWQLATIIPLWDSESEQLIFVNSKEFLLDKKIDSSYIKKEVLKEICGNIQHVGRNEAKILLTQLIQQSEMILYNQYVRLYSRECLVILQQMLDYNFYLSYVFMNRDKEEFASSEICDRFAKMIVKSIALNKKYGKDLKQELIDVNNILAFEKQAIQKGISFINYYMPEQIVIKNEQEVKSVFSEEYMIGLLNTVRMLYEFYILLDTFISDTSSTMSISDEKISICNLKNNSRFGSLELEEYDKMISYSIHTREKVWLIEHDLEMKYFFGVGVDEIDRFMRQLTIYMEKGISWLFFSWDTLPVLFTNVRMKTEDLKKFCSYFVLDKFYKENSAFQHEKSSIKPILKYGEDMFYTTVNMFQLGIMHLLEDIYDGNTANEGFNKIIQKKAHENRICFEKQVAEKIKKLYSNIFVKESITNLCGKELPGQIDVLCLYQNVIYVLECKASSLKVTMKEEQNFMKNFTKEGKKSFCGKLSEKIRFLRNNLDLLKKEYNCMEILDVRGAFVIRYPSAVMEKKDLQYPVVHINHVDKIFD